LSRKFAERLPFTGARSERSAKITGEILTKVVKISVRPAWQSAATDNADDAVKTVSLISTIKSYGADLASIRTRLVLPSRKTRFIN
jgi:hypothetical protein